MEITPGSGALTIESSNRAAKSVKPRRTEEILCYRQMPANRSTVRRHYARWRTQQGIPVRCDMPECVFHTQPLVWAGKPLRPILDHVNGNPLDNSPQNLRYVCPNCEALLSTHGGANRGRVQEAVEGKYVLKSRDGRHHYHLFPGHEDLNHWREELQVERKESG